MSQVSKLATLLAAAQARVAELTAKHDAAVAADAAEAAASNIEVGTEGSFTYGRAETKKELVGKVLLVVDGEHGKLLKVLSGEGKDAKLYDVSAKQFKIAAPLTEAEVPQAAPGEPTIDVSLVNAQAAAADLGVNLDDKLNQSPLTDADSAVAGL